MNEDVKWISRIVVPVSRAYDDTTEYLDSVARLNFLNTETGDRLNNMDSEIVSP
jgi:hypothetical protein